jgi:hypothetical protein
LPHELERGELNYYNIFLLSQRPVIGNKSELSLEVTGKFALANVAAMNINTVH